FIDINALRAKQIFKHLFSIDIKALTGKRNSFSQNLPMLKLLKIHFVALTVFSYTDFKVASA
ncbi:MAG: hypothetical protein LBH59_02760, partial [Planctomycetaceae bacterium]|nr:hypothetical protein [Planctomycetaceae bacterium]